MDVGLRIVAAGGWFANMANQNSLGDHDRSIKPRAVVFFMSVPVMYLAALSLLLAAAITDVMPNHEYRALAIVVASVSIPVVLGGIASVWLGWRCGFVPFVPSGGSPIAPPQPRLAPLTIHTRITGILTNVEGQIGGSRRYRERPAWMILGRTEAVLMVRTWEASMRMGRGVGENAAPASVARLESDCVSGLGAGTAHLATRQKPAILVSMNRTSLLLTFQDAGPRNQALADLTAWMNGQLLLDPSADNKANLKP